MRRGFIPEIGSGVLFRLIGQGPPALRHFHEDKPLAWAAHDRRQADAIRRAGPVLVRVAHGAALLPKPLSETHTPVVTAEFSWPRRAKGRNPLPAVPPRRHTPGQRPIQVRRAGLGSKKTDRVGGRGQGDPAGVRAMLAGREWAMLTAVLRRRNSPT